MGCALGGRHRKRRAGCGARENPLRPSNARAAATITIQRGTPGQQRRQQAVAAPPRPLTFYEREELLDEIRSGRPITAIKRYRELTGADLYTAKMTVEALRREIGR